MKNYLLSLLFIIMCVNSINSQISNKNKDDFERVYIEAGILYPLGNLKNRIEPAPNFGLWLKSKIKEDEFFDVGFNLTIQKNKENFNFEKNDSIFNNVPKGISGMVGLRYCKEFSLSKTKNINVEWFPSFGYAFFMYKSSLIGLKNNTVVNESVSKNVLSTFHIGQGVKFNIDNIALQLQYQFTPYHVFYEYIDKDFGSQSLIFGIVYKQ
jgi:hypothetical protein